MIFKKKQTDGVLSMFSGEDLNAITIHTVQLAFNFLFNLVFRPMNVVYDNKMFKVSFLFDFCAFGNFSEQKSSWAWICIQLRFACIQ